MSTHGVLLLRCAPPNNSAGAPHDPRHPGPRREPRPAAARAGVVPRRAVGGEDQAGRPQPRRSGDRRAAALDGRLRGGGGHRDRVVRAARVRPRRCADDRIPAGAVARRATAGGRRPVLRHDPGPAAVREGVRGGRCGRRHGDPGVRQPAGARHVAAPLALRARHRAAAGAAGPQRAVVLRLGPVAAVHGDDGDQPAGQPDPAPRLRLDAAALRPTGPAARAGRDRLLAGRDRGGGRRELPRRGDGAGRRHRGGWTVLRAPQGGPGQVAPARPAQRAADRAPDGAAGGGAATRPGGHAAWRASRRRWATRCRWCWPVSGRGSPCSRCRRR